MTDEEGTVSGDLEVTLDEAGRGLVRYRDTDTWYTIGNLDGEPPHPWDSVQRLAAAIEADLGARDAAGNVIPFEVFPEDDSAAGADTPAPDGPDAPAAGTGTTSDIPAQTATGPTTTGTTGTGRTGTTGKGTTATDADSAATISPDGVVTDDDLHDERPSTRAALL
ncbi:hypothetical protein, partial [Nocardia farcinica]|uniref:hypothetical protein n=1 Tax=Nocardia farcinica TaxID=37329 RepID=UPI00209BE2EA